MSMVFCRGCGKEIHETASTCPHCGAPQGPGIEKSKDLTIPDGIKGWSWGAFLFNWIWAIGNKTWIGLFAIIPYVGLIMAIVLGFKGREWAWKNKQWESVEHFNNVQKKWSVWGVAIVISVFVIGILAAIAIPAYQDYTRRANQAELSQTQANEDSTAVSKHETAEDLKTLKAYSYETETIFYGTLITALGETPDEKQVSYPAIQLDAPINVNVGKDPGDLDETEIGVMLLQLATDESTWAAFNNLKGSRVKVIGSLFHSYNGNHYTNVLIQTTSITPISR